MGFPPFYRRYEIKQRRNKRLFFFTAVRSSSSRALFLRSVEPYASSMPPFRLHSAGYVSLHSSHIIVCNPPFFSGLAHFATAIGQNRFTSRVILGIHFQLSIIHIVSVGTLSTFRQGTPPGGYLLFFAATAS
jgi:hypothetical protein